MTAEIVDPTKDGGFERLDRQPGLPAQLVAVRLFKLDVHGAPHKANALPKVVVHVDTDLSVSTDGETGAYLYVSVHCRLASVEASTDVVVSVLSVHQLTYRFENAKVAEAFVRQNALFHTWPYARALVSDMMGRMGIHRHSYTLPLIGAGVVAVQSELTRREQQEPKSVKKRTRRAASAKQP